MVQIVPLRCPYCGAPLSRDNLRCEFCGTELLLIQDGSAFQIRQNVYCSKCGSPMSSGAWLCMKCRNVPPENMGRVKELQTKFRFLKDDLIRNVPNLASAVDPEEFIYFVTHSKNIFYAATEKSLLLYSKKNLQRYPWSEVAAVGDVTPWYSWETLLGYELEVQTLKGPVKFQFPEVAVADAFRFRQEVLEALRLHNTGERDIRALILSLTLDEISACCENCGAENSFDSLYCGKCGKKIRYP